MASGVNNFNAISLQAYVVERCCIGTVPLVLISFGGTVLPKKYWRQLRQHFYLSKSVDSACTLVIKRKYRFIVM